MPSDPQDTLRATLFPLGALVCTPGAQSLLTAEQMGEALRRHMLGDWGELDEEDFLANDEALREGTRLLSCYSFGAPPARFYVITEADRSATTFLLPEEY